MTKPETFRTVGRDLERRLCAYALSASAAGIGMVSGTSAEAEVVYTPTQVTITRGSLPIDLNTDGIDDFILVDNFYFAPRSRFPFLGGRRLVLGGNASASAIPFNQEIAVLNSGSVIGSTRAFKNVHEPRVPMAAALQIYHGSTGTCCLSFVGQWANVKNKYLGLKFQINGQTHFGWARVTVRVFEDQFFLGRVNATLTGYAYETNPNTAIVAGDTGGTSTVTSKHSLGRLARGVSH